MKKINLKLKALEWSQHFSHHKSMGIFPNGQGQVAHETLDKPIRDVMGFVVACKNEDDPIKNEGARVVATLFIDFPDAQGQLTPKSVLKSCQNSNSTNL